MNKVMQLAKEFEPWTIETRRYFHRHPEVSMQEFETTKKIAEILEELGVEYETFKNCPGVIAKIVGKHPGKTVALRADIDALSIYQMNDVPYKSTSDGVMHACGHDAHIAMNLSAVKILKEFEAEVAGTVYFLFQPAEETAEGAKLFMQQGSWYQEVDNIFGIHIWSNMDTGTVSVEAGPRMAAADWFKIKVLGASGHGAQPEQTIDATVVSAAMVMNLQTLVSREFGPHDPLVVTVGKLHSGSRFNVISGEAKLEGTCRYFSTDIQKKIAKTITRVVQDTARTFRSEAEVEYLHATVPLANEETSSAIAQQAVVKTMGDQALQLFPATMGGEDFSFYLENKPGCFAFVGSRNKELKTDFPHHHECFDVDEAALKNGAALYAQYALDFLSQ